MVRPPHVFHFIHSLSYYIRFIEEPTAPDDILGHAAIRKGLKPHGIGVATGEHAHNRMVFKQLLQADAIDVVQIDSCRLAGVSEVLSVLFMAAKSVSCAMSMYSRFLTEYDQIWRTCVPSCRWCRLVRVCYSFEVRKCIMTFLSGPALKYHHPSLIDYISVSGTMERNVLEFVDHLHEHFVTPCSINSRGRYNVPMNPNEGYRCVE